MPTLYTVTRCGIVYKYTVALCVKRVMTPMRMWVSTHFRIRLTRPVVVPIPMQPRSHNRTRRPAFYYS